MPAPGKPALLCVLLVALGLGAGSAAAADGDLRNFFSGDGRVVTDVEAGSKDEATAMSVDRHGRLVVAGVSVKAPQGGRLAVARYLPNGSLDPSFGVGGLVVSDAEGGLNPRDVSIDAAGRIVLGGLGVHGRPTVARLLPDGRFDPSLGGDGIVGFDDVFEVEALTLDAAGRIVLAGAAGIGPDPSFAAARLLPDGTPDRSLGGTGFVIVDVAPGTSDLARDVLVDSFGRIVLGGGAWLPREGISWNIGRFALVRLHEDGRLDRSLRGSGVALIALTKGSSSVNAMVPHGRGNVVLAGDASPYAGFVKVRGAGGLDKRFGQNGRVKLDVQNYLEPVALANGGNARILAALGVEAVHHDGGGPLIATRLLPLGKPDRSFSEDSRAVTGFGRWRATAATIASIDFGDVAIAGPAKRADTDHHDFAVARYEG